MLARSLLRSKVTLPLDYLMLYNGSNGGSTYDLGLARSTDRGVTWTVDPANPIIEHGDASWCSVFLVQASLIKVGALWYAYAAGFDGTDLRIGLFTSPDLVTWTDRGVVLGLGSGGSFDDANVNLPIVVYDPDAVHPFQMWYTGWPDDTAVNTKIGYAYHDGDGLSAFTRGGQVLDVGSGGAFDDSGLATGPVIKIGSTYYVYYAGYHSSVYHTGLATTTDPEDDGAYVKQGVLSGFSGNLTVGVSYGSNHLRSLVKRGSLYLAYFSVFHPGGIPGTEAMGYTTTSDLETFTTPLSGPLVALGSGWDSNSAENPTVVPVP